MKKILIIGSGGAGKSTLARRLSKILEIDAIHLDTLYWHSGWVETPRAEWEQQVTALVTRDAWIMDGNYSGTLDIRIAACDTIIFLDLAPMICLWRAFKRWLRYRHHTRPDMAEGCPERFSFEFIVWILSYPVRTRPRVLQLIHTDSANSKLFHLRSTKEVEAFLASLTQATSDRSPGSSSL